MKPSVWKMSIVVGCAVVFVVLAPYTTAQIDPAKNWLQGRYDALNTGFSPTTLPSKPPKVTQLLPQPSPLPQPLPQGEGSHAGGYRRLFPPKSGFFCC
jgi:hypothetical protein